VVVHWAFRTRVSARAGVRLIGHDWNATSRWTDCCDAWDLDDHSLGLGTSIGRPWRRGNQKAGEVSQDLRVWLRYRSEKYLGEDRTPPERGRR
jgi:hypothetical protein